MGRSQETFSKKEKEKKRLKKRKEKAKKREERKSNSQGSSLDDMIAYVDENGNIVDTPPEEQEKADISAEDIEVSVPKREEEELPTVRTGKVAYFDHSKGYGFITDQLTQEKFFVHINDTIDSIDEADKVSYELEQGRKGLNAVRVKKV